MSKISPVTSSSIIISCLHGLLSVVPAIFHCVCHILLCLTYSVLSVIAKCLIESNPGYCPGGLSQFILPVYICQHLCLIAGDEHRYFGLRPSLNFFYDTKDVVKGESEFINQTWNRPTITWVIWHEWLIDWLSEWVSLYLTSVLIHRTNSPTLTKWRCYSPTMTCQKACNYIASPYISYVFHTCPTSTIIYKCSQ